MSQLLISRENRFRNLSLLFVLPILMGAVLAVLMPALAYADTPIFVRPGGSDIYCVGIANADFSPGIVPACAVQSLQRAAELAGPSGTIVVSTATGSTTIPLDQFPPITPSGGDFTIAAAPVTTLTVTKADWPDPVLLNTPLTYTIRVTNTGPADTPNPVTLIDILPSIDVVTQP